MDYQHDEIATDMLQPCDEWQQLITAAECAGRRAARQLAVKCSTEHLAREGNVTVHVEPAESPAALWLGSRGRADFTDTGALVPVTITEGDLRPARQAAAKARSLLVHHAYATAFCTVLAEEAGVTAEVRLADQAPASKGRSRSELPGHAEPDPA
ncbi:hypothetical protein [Saccharopolyspora sp. NPDC002578]